MLCIVGGDLSPKNVWLAETVLDIFTENRFVNNFNNNWASKEVVQRCQFAF